MDNSMSKILAAAVVALIVAGGIFAFTSNEEAMDEATETTTTEQATSDPAPAAEVTETGSTIVELAQATDDLSTLVTAVVAADLAGTLGDSDGGPFTVVAPANDAFAALEDGVLESLLEEENVAQLTDILTFHVVEGDVRAADLSDGQVVTTLQGDTLTVSITDGTVMIGDATVTSADVEANNGVVHIIDTVLLP